MNSLSPSGSLRSDKLAHAGMVRGHGWQVLEPGRAGRLCVLEPGQADLAAVLGVVLVAAAPVGLHVALVVPACSALALKCVFGTGPWPACDYHSHCIPLDSSELILDHLTKHNSIARTPSGFATVPDDVGAPKWGPEDTCKSRGRGKWDAHRIAVGEKSSLLIALSAMACLSRSLPLEPDLAELAKILSTASTV